MGRVKDWWMDEIDKVINSYAADLKKGTNQEEAWDKAFKELSNLAGHEYADECLSAVTPILT